MKFQVRSAVLTMYPQVARAVGLEPSRMLQAAGIDAGLLEESEKLLPAESFRRLLELSAHEAGRDDFGLLLGETRTLSVLGPLGLLMREEPTLRAALDSAARYLVNQSDALELGIDEHGSEARIAISTRLRPGRGPAAGTRQLDDLLVAALYRMLQLLMGEGWPAEACLRRDPPRCRSTFERVFEGRVNFGEAFDGVRCRSSDLDADLRSADPAFARYLRHHLDERARAGRAATLEARVRAIACERLPRGRCTADAVAGQIGVDRRTLHRHLAAEGSSFSKIVDETRRDAASRLLESRHGRLADVASQLGFADASCFSRWFRQRFGASPKAWSERRQETA